MYFPISWPKVINTFHLQDEKFVDLVCNRDRILVALLTNRSLAIWLCNPCLPIVISQRSDKSRKKFGENVLVEWKPDSSMLVVSTTDGCLLFYKLMICENEGTLYEQRDPIEPNLKRDSAELFSRETIPAVELYLVRKLDLFDGAITSISCISLTELMIATQNCHVFRYRWDFSRNRDYDLDLHRIPFCINQQVIQAEPIVSNEVHISDMFYSPLTGGFSVTLNDGRAAFLTATTSKFDPNQTQGIWAQDITDATCTTINHKYRLITFGKKNSKCHCYTVDESTGGLILSHSCSLSNKDYPNSPGAITQLRWTPDCCALAMIWEFGGFSIWSTFGSLLSCSLTWDYGSQIDLLSNNPLLFSAMEWSVGGYQLWFIQKQLKSNKNKLFKYDFVKSALTLSPSMNQENHLYLQGCDKLYVNLTKHISDLEVKMSTSSLDNDRNQCNTPSMPFSSINSTLAEGKQWLTISVPHSYLDTNWPIKYSAIDSSSEYLVISGRTGIALCSLRKLHWKLFGNEMQEKSFVVTGGLLWWRKYIVLGCVNLSNPSDEIRLYSRDNKLDNRFVTLKSLSTSLLLLNSQHDYLITFCSNAMVDIYTMAVVGTTDKVVLTKIKSIDVSELCIHTVSVISVMVMCLENDTVHKHEDNDCIESIILNISGKLVMVNCELTTSNDGYICVLPTILASCVENIWLAKCRKLNKIQLTEALWLHCGVHGMRVWLPLMQKGKNQSHTFMAKRIMLPFNLNIYPLTICFEDAIILGVESDTNLYISDNSSHFSLPFCVLKRTSQVYLHQILRQLIQRNLGNLAWEIAKSCSQLPYFPHSLELLLHEVLEEEATSKEPNPDAYLSRIVEFILEFPMYYMQTIVQCARKTEIARWPHLFSVVGKPKDLFEKCLANNQLDVASSYLIIIQNLENGSLSFQLAIDLLNATLRNSNWQLAKDLVRFLKAIKPCETESPRNSIVMPVKRAKSRQSIQLRADDDDIGLVFDGVPKMSRSRSISTTLVPKMAIEQSQPMQKSCSFASGSGRKKSLKYENGDSDDNGVIDAILEKFAVSLLYNQDLMNFGYFSAYLDFHLVHFLSRERNRSAKVVNFIAAFMKLHEDFSWPYSNKELSYLIYNGDKYKQKLVEVDRSSSIVGDSGYTSLSDRCIQKSNNFKSNVGYFEIHSTTSSLLTDERDKSIISLDDSSSFLAMDNVSMKNKISRSEVQLCYLLQIMIEANCLEWALLLAIVLQDVMAVTRIINASKSSDRQSEQIQRLKNGFSKLSTWCNKECLDYVEFLKKIEEGVNQFDDQFITKNHNDDVVIERIYDKVELGPIVSEPTSISVNKISDLTESISRVNLNDISNVIDEKKSEEKGCVVS